jgi:hypothetical protein
MTNVVSGSTTGGTLTLTQIATGGAGGGGLGGIGGAATSSLTFDDVTANTRHASSVTGTVGAYGGAGGSEGTGQAAGGVAIASLTLIGAHNVTASSTATGGAGGISSASRASATAIGQGAHGGTVSAIATGQGASGTADATASTSLSGTLVTAVASQASAPVAGKSTSLAWAAIGRGKISAPAFVTDQSEAQITAEPTSADVKSILTANPNISKAFSTTPTYFGIGELGGAHSASSSAFLAETGSVQMTVNLTKAGTLHDLLIGFYGGTALGNIASDPAFSVTLDVNINGADNKNTFTTVSAANAFFQNNAVDYGALSGTSLQLDISLSITESATSNGYDFGMLIGDPPPASDAAAHHNLVAAMATFGTNASGSSGTFAPGPQDDRHAMLAAHPV